MASVLSLNLFAQEKAVSIEEKKADTAIKRIIAINSEMLNVGLNVPESILTNGTEPSDGIIPPKNKNFINNLVKYSKNTENNQVKL